MIRNNVDELGFEVNFSEREIADTLERINRKRFEDAVTVVPFASASDADRAQYPAPANLAVHEYWANMIA